jgi:hypothetical protein
MSRSPKLLLLSLCAVLLAGCDALGIESGTVVAERKESDGKAIGSACRHALRAIEDCYTLNPKASKSAVYAGWLEMDSYMRENKLEGIVPVVPRKGAKPEPAPSAPEGEAAAEDSGGKSGHDGAADKAAADSKDAAKEAGQGHDKAGAHGSTH